MIWGALTLLLLFPACGWEVQKAAIDAKLDAVAERKAMEVGDGF